MKNVLIIVPHPDDELLVGGALIPKLNKNNRVFICYVTNGDFYAHEGYARLREAISATSILGVNKNDVFF